ncbi:MAG: hypothetical protein ACTS6A_00320 [Candidatus Hodgkinia cicadicola]
MLQARCERHIPPAKSYLTLRLVKLIMETEASTKSSEVVCDVIVVGAVPLG